MRVVMWLENQACEIFPTALPHVFAQQNIRGKIHYLKENGAWKIEKEAWADK